MNTKGEANEPNSVLDGKSTNFAEALRALQEDAKRAGTDKLTIEEIIEEIATYRREKREQELASK